MSPASAPQRASSRPSSPKRSRLSLLLAVAMAFSGGSLLAAQAVSAAPSDDAVLILGTTVAYGAESAEATYAASLGFDVDIVDAETWAGMSAEDFGSYRAIILGDYPCGYPTVSDYIGAAEANAGTWGPAVDGNVIVVGTDPEAHGKSLVTHNAIDLVTADAGKTGAYVNLSCYYHGVAPGTPAPVLDGLSTFGDFTVTGIGGCFDSVHVVADHPALDGLTDAYLSNWGCSVHEGMDSWPSDFIVLALATTGGVYTATDGTVGTPFILARGASFVVVSDVTIDGPASGTLGSSVDLVATVDSEGSPVVDATVTFKALDGSAHAGTLGTAVTDESGVATLAFTGTTAGTDLVTASFVDAGNATQTSGTHSVAWSAPTPTPDPTDEPTASPSTEPTASPSTEPTASPSTEPTASPSTDPSGSLDTPTGPPTVAPSTTPSSWAAAFFAAKHPKAGVAAPYTTQVNGCVDACTFDWYVNGGFVKSTTDEPTAAAGLNRASTPVVFTAMSEVPLALETGLHKIVVEIASGNGQTATVSAVVSIGGATITPPPTDADASPGAGTSTLANALAMLLLVGALAVVTMLGRQTGAHRSR